MIKVLLFNIRSVLCKPKSRYRDSICHKFVRPSSGDGYLKRVEYRSVYLRNTPMSSRWGRQLCLAAGHNRAERQEPFAVHPIPLTLHTILSQVFAGKIHIRRTVFVINHFTVYSSLFTTQYYLPPAFLHLHFVSGRSGIPTMSRPIGMEKFPSGFIDAFVLMGAEVIALRL